MYFKSRKPKQSDQAFSPELGMLKVGIPHWAAEVRIFNSLLQPVMETSKIKSDSEAKGLFSMESILEPGAYQVQVFLEGKTESAWIPIDEGKITEVSPKAWKTLKFTSASPIIDIDNSNKTHTDKAVELSRKITWQGGSGNSRLFLFIRTLDPKSYGETFSEGLKLLDKRGEVVTDFSEGIEKDKRRGWMGFNADLPSGEYILRRGRSGVRLSHQVFYLCEGYETQIFLNARRYPLLNTWSLSMATLGSGFNPSNYTILAEEAIMDGLRYGTNNFFLLQNEKIKEIIEKTDVLLEEKNENPWLGVLAAHSIMRLQEQMRDPSSEAPEYLNILENKLKPFLERTIGDHPDVRALLLVKSVPTNKPFDFPPSLRTSLRLVQSHSLQCSNTIPIDSLTDCIIDSPMTNSLWTGWRRLTRQPIYNLEPKAKGFSLKPSVAADFSISSVLSQTAAPRTPVYYIAEGEQETSVKTVLRDAPMIQKAKEIVINYARTFDLGNLPEKINFNSADQIDRVLKQITPEEISKNFGIPLARTEEGLKSLLSQVGNNVQSDEPTAQTPVAEKSLITVQQTILEYALNKFAKSESETTGTVQALAKYTIREIVNKIQSEADRLSAAAFAPQQNLDCSISQLLQPAQRLYSIAENLLKYSYFAVITDTDGKTIYCNGTFLQLTSPKSLDRVKSTEQQIKDVRSAKIRAWESVLASAKIGLSEVKNLDESSDWQNWELSRTEIEDTATSGFVRYLNVLGLKGFSPLGESALEEIDQWASNLSSYVPLMIYGSGEKREEYSKNLNDIILQLENHINKFGRNTKKNPKKRKGKKMNEIENNPNEPTLFDKEFFGISRHNLITGTAARLFSPNTAAKIKSLLDPVAQVFDDVGGWADEIKSPANAPDDQETRNFLSDQRNRSHGMWHFVNVPLGAESYAQAAQLGFTRENDVVQMTKECVRVLQRESDRFSQVNALRLLGHLVGDIHQPLHIGCGFIDERESPPKFVEDPQIIKQNGFKSDSGGNDITLPDSAGKLHGYWDSGLGGLIDTIELDAPQSDAAADETAANVAPVADEETRARVIEQLYQMAKSSIDNTPSALGAADEIEVIERAEIWANESHEIARTAYSTFKITERVERIRRGRVEVSYKVSWEGRALYNARCAPFLRSRMAMAARHLAEMLNTIFG